MTDETLSPTPFDDADWERLAEAADRLIEAWNSDSEPVLAEFIPVDPGDPRFGKMVLYLIRTDHECRRETGKTKGAEEYVADFPQLLSGPEMVAAVEEALVTDDDGATTVDRRTHTAGGSKGRRREPWRRPEAIRVLCPNPKCRRLLDVTDDEVAAKMVCPGCGERFRLSDAGVPIKTLPNDRVCPRRRIAHFELLEQIGTGAFGSVWKAWDTELKRIVAIKLPKTGQLGIDVDRFFREAEAAAQLEHPNIVSVYAEGQEEGVLYIVSSFIEGTNLKHWREDHDLSPRDAASLCATITDALHYAHEHGVVHRDVKPENILIDPDGEPHVADFGLAKLIDQQATLSATGNFMGSPSYMSPEQAKGHSHKADARSDVFSLGVILYELLTGVLPFRERNFAMLLVMVCEEEPPSIRTLDARIPRDLETICAKCLEKDPAKRYQSAGELADELRRYLENKPIVARPIGFTGKTWRWCKRQPVVAGLLAAFVAAMVGGMGGSTYFAVEAGREAKQKTEAFRRESAERKRAEEQTRLAQKSEEEARANAKETERQLYFSQIYRATALLDSGRHTEAFGVLTTIPLERREWEARYLIRQAEGTLLTIQGHAGTLNSFALSPDGRRIVSGSEDRTVKVSDAETGKEMLTFRGHDSSVLDVEFSPDGRRIVSGSTDKTARLWDAETGKEVQILRGHDGLVDCVKFSPDGRRILSTSGDKTIKLWDAETGEEILTFCGHKSSRLSVKFSPDGRRIVSTGADKTIKVWDVETGKEIHTLRRVTGLVLPEVAIPDATFSPDGRRIAGSSGGNTIKLWDVETGEEVRTLGRYDGFVSTDCVAFSPDGRWIVAASGDVTIRMWDAETGEEIHTLRGLDGFIGCVAFSPDGRRIVGGSGNTIKLWDAETGREIHTFRGYHGVLNGSIAFTPDGRRIVSASRYGIKVWDTEMGNDTFVLGGNDSSFERHAFGGSSPVFWNVALSPDARRLACYDLRHPDNGVTIWDTETRKETVTLPGHTVCFAFSSDARWVVAGSFRRITVWDVETGKDKLLPRGHKELVSSVAFSPDGRRIVSGSADKTIKVWDVETGKELYTLRGHKDGVLSVAFGPDGRRIVSTDCDTIKVWDATTGRNTITLEGHASGLGKVTFSADGRQIISRGKVWDADTGKDTPARAYARDVAVAEFNAAMLPLSSPDGRRIVGGGPDNTVKVWDANTGKEMLSLGGHKEAVWIAAFSADSQRIISVSADRAVKVWDARLSNETLTLDEHANSIASIAFSPDERRLATRDKSGVQIIWDVATGKRLPDDPTAKTWANERVSADGLTRVVPVGNTIRLIRTNPNYDPWAKDAARRAAWELDWCRRDAMECEVAKNWFAARFHLRRLAELKPNDETVQSRLKHAEAMLAEEGGSDTEVSADSPRKEGAGGASEGE